MELAGPLVTAISFFIAAIFGAFIYYKQQKVNNSLEEIHTLVNSRLSEALHKINRLEKYFGAIPGDTIGEPLPKHDD